MIDDASILCMSDPAAVAVAALVLLESGLLVWLFLDRSRRARAEKQLLQSSAALEHALLERARDLQQAMVDLHDARASLGQLHKQYDLGARIDSLTGLFNRRHIEERIVEEFSRFQRNGTPFSVIIVEVDRLREIGDQHGREACDLLLKSMATEAALTVRPYDVVSRWNEEEFLLLLPNTDEPGVKTFGERICARLSSREFSHGDVCLRATVSCGYATVRSGDTLIDVVQHAAAALRHMKDAGNAGDGQG